MSPGVEFCLLGPLVVRCGGLAVPVPEGRQRTLHMALLCPLGHAQRHQRRRDSQPGVATTG